MKKGIVKKILFGQIFLTLLGLVLLSLISIPLYKNFSQRYKVNKEMRELEQEINSVNQKNESLKKVVDYLKSDQFIEEQARMNMGMKKPGEDVVIINGLGNAATNSTSSLFSIKGLENQKPPANTNPAKWRDYFFSHKETNI